MEADPTWFEREYNPRLLVPNAPEIYGAWAERAAAARRRHPPEADLRYGDHARERLDLFRAEAAWGTVVFIHGGYWRAFSKDDFSWIVDGFLGQGLSVALPSYPLCPEVGLDRIRASMRAAFAQLYRRMLTPAERRAIVVTGHSAGGYLAALHLMTDWTGYGLPADAVAGVVPISGVFRLAPLIHTTMNQALGLDDAMAAALGLHDRAPCAQAAVGFAVGGDESAEFHRQSQDMARNWASLRPVVLDIAGRNHFDVIDDLARPASELNSLITRFARSRPGP